MEPSSATFTQQQDIVCFSHLRWNFVYQRPQHLLTRFARERRVFYIEEPIFDGAGPSLQIDTDQAGVYVVRMHLPERSPASVELQRKLLARLLRTYDIRSYVAWYYTPMALAFTQDLRPDLTVFDCMDELSAFAGAPPELAEYESLLLNKADVVFTGGRSLYEARACRHPRVYLFPSAVDAQHFRRARQALSDAADQQGIERPRIGFFGVLDERLDVELLGKLAESRPQWQFVLLGPVVKIEEAVLPRAANIHYLGMKSYQELPVYIANWDVAILPFALNEATRSISPTKVPEYLAAGRPVVSTPIPDVVRWHDEDGLIAIGEDHESFVSVLEKALQPPDKAWLDRVDKKLATMSWQTTWSAMNSIMADCLSRKQAAAEAPVALLPAPAPSVRAASRVTADV